MPTDDLASAISLRSAGNNLLRIGGPALAAPILAAWGAGWAFAVYAATNVVMVLMLCAHPPADPTSTGAVDTLERLAAMERRAAPRSGAHRRPSQC